MTVSAVAQEGLPLATGVTYLTFMSTMPPDVVLGAFTGSIIFLLGVTNKPKWQWTLYFSISFMAGLLGAKPMAEVVASLLHLVLLQANIPGGMGAMISAACTINVLIWLRDHPTFFLRKKGEEA